MLSQTMMRYLPWLIMKEFIKIHLKLNNHNVSSFKTIKIYSVINICKIN